MKRWTSKQALESRLFDEQPLLSSMRFKWRFAIGMNRRVE
jgi:hypothetical protein